MQLKRVVNIVLIFMLLMGLFPSLVYSEVNTSEVFEKQSLKCKVNDSLTINVEGAFSEGSSLKVSGVGEKDVKQTASQIERLRDDSKNSVRSDIYDIKVIDKNGDEYQPDESFKITFDYKNIDENLKADIYHTDSKLNTERLKTRVEDNKVSAVSKSFSYYTVEFYYGDKEYVMPGGSEARLSKILDSVGLYGNVSSWDISDKTLFDVVKKDDDFFLVSFKPFTTEEWLKVTVDGIEYKIKVTDAIRVDEHGNQVDANAKYLIGSDTDVGTVGTITDNRVIQGPLESNFTSSLPLAEIFIDDKVVDMSLFKKDDLNGTKVKAELLVNSTQNNGKYKGFTLNTNVNAVTFVGGSNSASLSKLSQSYGGLTYDFSKRYLNNTRYLTANPNGTQNNYELFSGDIVRYTLKGMAIKYDETTKQYKDYDVIITYSDILITVCNASNANQVDQSTINGNSGKLTLMDTNAVCISFDGSSKQHRAGVTYKANVKVVDPDTKELVSGSYYYPMVDIDVSRATNAPMVNLYQADNNMRYSEQVALMGNYGRPTVSGTWEQKVWIPGGVWSANPITTYANITTNKHPYGSSITSETIDGQANTLIFKPAGTSNTTVHSAINKYTDPDQGLDNSFYSGFLTLANNTAGGIRIKGWGSATASNPGGMESYILTGSRPVNYKLAASSGTGGTIYTTDMGNPEGNLSVGKKVGTSDTYSPYMIASTLGQSITYTMTPQPGYKLKKVYTKNGDIDVMEDFQNGTATENTNLRNIGNGVYAYDFTQINSDNSVHVEWEPTKLKVKKQLSNSTATNENFTFRMKVWGSTHGDYDIKTALEAQGCTQVSENTYEFTVKGNNEKEFSSVIPFGWNYEITEVDKDGWAFESSSSNATISNFDGDETVTFTNRKSIHDLTVSKETVDDVPGEFEFDVKVWKEKPEAYAVFDSSDKSLKFFRDDRNKYTNNQTDGTKTYYTGIETTNYTNTSQISWYNNSTNVQSVTFQDPIKPVSTAYWFSGMSQLNAITGIEKLDTSNVTDMSYMFYSCTSLTTLDLSHLDTSNVTNMSFMFYACYNLRTVLNIMKMPQSYTSMCGYAAIRDFSGLIILKYISPVTSADVDTLVATKASSSCLVTNGGEGLFIPPAEPEGGSGVFAQYLDLSQYGGVSNGDNSYRFTVNNGDSFTIPDIPEDYQYEIKEVVKEGWENISKTNDKGTLTEDTVSEWVNEKKSNLTISKTVKGNLGDTTKDFTFELTSDRLLTVSGITPSSYTEEKYRGSCSIRAQNGVYNMTSLVTGYPGYIKLSKEGATTYNNIDDTWSVEQTVFNNVKEMTISGGRITFKLLNGKVFRFGFPNLSEGASATANNFRELVTTYTYIFTLKGGDELEIVDVPYGANVSVKERASNYIASVVATDSDVIVDKANSSSNTALSTDGFIMKEDTDVAFTNTREMKPATGLMNSTNLILLLIVIVGGCLGVAVKRYRSAKKDGAVGTDF